MKKRYYHYPEDTDVIRACPPYLQVEGNVEVEVWPIGTVARLKEALMGQMRSTGYSSFCGCPTCSAVRAALASVEEER